MRNCPPLPAGSCRRATSADARRSPPLSASPSELAGSNGKDAWKRAQGTRIGPGALPLRMERPSGRKDRAEQAAQRPIRTSNSTGRPNLAAADGAKLLMSRLRGQSGFPPAKWSVAQKPLQLSDRSLVLKGREDDQLHVRRVAHAKARIFEQHSPGRRVVDTLLAGKRPGHLALGPPAGKLGAQAHQTRDKALEIRVAGVARAIGAEHGERRARHRFPID